MATVTLTVSEQEKAEFKSFLWVNWSELSRAELIEDEKTAEDFEMFKKIAAKSKLTEEDALRLGREVNKSLHKRYKKIYPGRL